MVHSDMAITSELAIYNETKPEESIMPSLYGRYYSKAELLERVGDISQVGGVRRYVLADGSESGVEVAEFRTGTGFNFNVLLSRGMDISLCEYKGMPLSWRSPTGDVGPSYYEPLGFGWLRSFHGGLVVTCGMTHAGAPCEDMGKELGLHGRASNIPAKNTWVDGEWQGDDYVMWAQGRVREAAVFGENVCMTRRVWARLGESRLFLHDVVENLGFEPIEHMYLYHINIGFPIVDEGAELLSPSVSVRPRDEEAEKGKEDYGRFSRPMPGYKEKVYYHEMGSDREGNVYVALVNRRLGEGFGIYVKYPKAELPRFVEWKMMGQGTYVVGLEPSNCLVEGRAKERERGTLMFLGPWEKKEYRLEIGVLSSSEDIRNIEAKVIRCRED